jgi:alpha-maltose-1-phosphate synthase
MTTILQKPAAAAAMTPAITLVHPTSNPFARNAALALAEQQWLQEIVTTTAYNPAGRLAQRLQGLPPRLFQSLTQELGRRTWVAPAGASLSSHPWKETLRVGLTKAGLLQKLGQKLGWSQQSLVDWVYASLDHHVAQQHLAGLNAIYAYEDGAAETFATARAQGITCLYDLPIAFYRTSQRIQAEEAERFPELAPALQAAQEPQWKLARKEQEIQLADHIFVASSMTQRSLLEAKVSPEKISVIPYGAPIEYFQPQSKADSRFRALFVGRVGPRKGVHYLLPAWQHLQLPNAELMLIGINEFPASWTFQQQPGIRYIPSVPHASLNTYYSGANVFVFPSLVEGFGLVLLEAMACGIPIITTPNTAGPDIITDGLEGFIVPIRDTAALQERLHWCYHHPQELAEMGRAARQKAEQFTWARYRQILAQEVSKVLAVPTQP